jgi:hypothetical protein
MTNLQTIEVGQLALVTGGQQQGTFERIGGNVGQQLGQWGSQYVPPPANMLLPPIGRQVGQQAGRMVDRWFQR